MQKAQHKCWALLRSGRDSNPRPHAWQACILTNWTTGPFPFVRRECKNTRFNSIFANFFHAFFHTARTAYFRNTQIQANCIHERPKIQPIHSSLLRINTTLPFPTQCPVSSYKIIPHRSRCHRTKPKYRRYQDVAGGFLRSRKRQSLWKSDPHFSILTKQSGYYFP